MRAETLHPPLEEIAEIFRKHHGQLSSVVRYDRFRTSEELEEWVFLLGPDVLSLTHPHATADITQRFISFNNNSGLTLDPEENALLSLTPWIHDLGELIIEGEGVGDVSYEWKTGEDEKKEVVIFHRVLTDLPDGNVKDSIRKAYHEVAMGRGTKLGRMFNAIERIGYLETAIRAFLGIDGKKIKNWKGLMGNVLSNQIEALLAYSSEYPYVAQFLKENMEVISRMLDEAIAYEAPLSTDVIMYDHSKVQRAATAWRLNNLS